MIVNEQEFKENLVKKGYGEPAVREREPNLNKEMHTHDKSAMALVTAGELTLVYENNSISYGPVECCELLAGTLLTEKTGPKGAITLLAHK